jgi:predicted metal-dependent phosphoesterase TrpH
VRIDLHTHTTHSDGTLPPAALVRAARDAGLCGLAVTDHDTTSALEEAAAEGRAVGVEVYAGCEISTQVDGDTVHVLAYGFEPEDAGLQAFLARVRCGREERNDRLFERLAALGVPVERHEVAAHAPGRIVARPHFARALVARGHVPDVRTAFQRYLGDRAPGYVEPATPSPESAVEAVVRAGGAAVLAHPKQLRLPDAAAYRAFLERLCAVGLAGVEVDHPSHSAEERARFRDLATALDLVPTGGSDFHGDAKPHCLLGVGDGTIDVRRITWERLAGRRRR